MQISWLGHAGFKIVSKETVVAIDPYDGVGLKMPRFNADILLMTSSDSDHGFEKAIRGNPFVVSGAGEYEVKGVFVYGVAEAEQKDPVTIYMLESENIKVVGAAFGGGGNVARSQDIIMLLVMQNNMRHGGNIASFNNVGSEPAVEFYTSFTNPKKRFYTWNEDQVYSIDAFTQRKAAMMINYSYGIQNIIDKTGNTLNFKVAPIPQADPSPTSATTSLVIAAVP